MTNEPIYPSMVIRSQAKTIELLEKQLEKYKNIIKEVREYVNNYFVIGAESEYLKRLNEILDKVGA